MRSIHLEGLRFEGGAGEATYTIDADSVRGWLIDGVDVRREEIARPAAHGAFETPGFLTGRAISWGGDIETSNATEQDHAMRRLSGLLAGGRFGRLVVENDSSLWTKVQRGGDFDMNMHLYGRVASYRVQFWAPDPRIYGKVREFGQGQPAVHYGNFEASPRLIVGAGSGGYTVTGPGGRQVVVSSGAPAGEHYIDFARGGLFTAAGVRVPGVVSVFQPWTVGPGVPGVVASITGSRSLVQRVTDTYI